jgi:hypothetical protein
MKKVIVRYKVKEDKAQQNIEFIQNENGSKTGQVCCCKFSRIIHLWLFLKAPSESGGVGIWTQAPFTSPSLVKPVWPKNSTPADEIQGNTAARFPETGL